MPAGESFGFRQRTKSSLHYCEEQPGSTSLFPVCSRSPDCNQWTSWWNARRLSGELHRIIRKDPVLYGIVFRDRSAFDKRRDNRIDARRNHRPDNYRERKGFRLHLCRTATIQSGGPKRQRDSLQNSNFKRMPGMEQRQKQS